MENMRLVQIKDKLHCDFVEYIPSELLDKTRQIHITDVDRLAIGITKCFDVENNRVIDYDNTEDLRIQKIEELRQRREVECFSIINRGKLWYDTLTPEQLEELQEYYKKWLDVTETLVEPTKPEWLK